MPGKWHQAVDLPAPLGVSISDGIDRFRAVLNIIYIFCNGTIRIQRVLLSKGRYKQAYRMVPVHPEDQHLLGIQWQGVAYILRYVGYYILAYTPNPKYSQQS